MNDVLEEPAQKDRDVVCYEMAYNENNLFLPLPDDFENLKCVNDKVVDKGPLQLLVGDDVFLIEETVVDDGHVMGHDGGERDGSMTLSSENGDIVMIATTGASLGNGIIDNNEVKDGALEENQVSSTSTPTTTTVIPNDYIAFEEQDGDEIMKN